MEEKAIYEQYAAIKSLLNARRLKEALAQLQAFAQQASLYEVINICESIATSYGYMLQYMGEGAPDPERINMYNKLLAQAYDLNEQAVIAIDDKRSNRFYFQNRRTYILNDRAPKLHDIAERLESFNDNLALSELISESKRKEIIDRNEVALKDLFMTTWCSCQWSNGEAEVAESLLHSDRININALCLMVSAVTLSVMECLDTRKVEWLCNAYSHEDLHVGQRALVGIAITALVYSERLRIYPSLTARLKMLDETTAFSADMSRLYLQLLLCQETEKIGMKMRDEILPDMMKKASKLTSRMKDMETDDEEDMPEWESLINDSGIEENMRKLNELQSEGADIQMSSFCTLKSFSFFNEIHHWLYPFDMMQQDVIRAKGDSNSDKGLEFVLNSGTFCDNDKYSFYFMFMNMPKSNNKKMFENMQGMIPEDVSEEVSEHIKESINKRENICNSYLHDIYRFFHLYFYRAEFRNIFAHPIELHTNDVLKPYINNEGNLITLASYHLKKEHWEIAADIIGEIVEMGGTTASQAETYQKLGYALQKSKHITEAIDAYATADTIKPTLWTDKRMATCYRLIHDYEKALKLYRKIDEGGNGNANITYYIGSCLVELKRCAEALNIFFKLDFSEEESVRAWRGIAWCSFITGKYEQAMKYYRKVIEVKPTTGEYMNAGHVAWCMGDTRQAAGYYRKVAESVATKSELIDLFAKEKSYLSERGIGPDEIALMIDLLY